MSLISFQQSSMPRLLILAFFTLLFSDCGIAKGVNSNPDLKQFGFKPDGFTDNTVAFKKLTTWLDGKKNVTINLPAGTYRVGQQRSTKSSYLIADDILKINNCTNIKINLNNAILLYNDGLKFGSFDPRTNQKYNTGKKPFSELSHRAQLGNCILINNSSNIDIINGTLDGNSSNLIIGGNWGNKGIQLTHNGIKVLNSFNVNLVNITSKNFALDGFNINNSNSTTNNNITMSKCKSSYCGRQGLSWVGGNGLHVDSSVFEHTGQGVISSAPASGIDIEPIKNQFARNGLIQNCTFTNNQGPDLLIGNGDNRSIICRNSTFFSSGTITIWPRNGDLLVDNCSINGPLGALSTTLDKKIVFKNCTITDNVYGNNKFIKRFLFDIGGAGDNVEVSGCTIKCYSKPLIYITDKPLKGAAFIFKNNNIELYYTKSINRIGVFGKGLYENNTITNYTNDKFKIGNIEFIKSKNMSIKGSRKFLNNSLR